MFGLDSAQFVDVPESEACRLAERGTTVARFRFVGDAAPAAVTRVAVVDTGDRAVLRYRGPTREVRVVTREALPRLAANLLDGDAANDRSTADGRWVLDCEEPCPDWATRPT